MLMKNAMLIILLAAASAAGARPIDWPEQSERLVSGETTFSSPLCGEKETKVSLLIDISKRGEVKHVSRNKESLLQNPGKKIMDFLISKVRKWEFKPVKIGDSFVEVTTKPTVLCH
jgi:hypothetical protein